MKRFNFDYIRTLYKDRCVLEENDYGYVDSETYGGIMVMDNLDRAEYILNEVIPNSYHNTKITGENTVMECPDCGWYGSSEYVGGGGQIADTGDYGDVYCPICSSIDVYNVDSPMITMTEKELKKLLTETWANGYFWPECWDEPDEEKLSVLGDAWIECFKKEKYGKD